MSLPKSQVLKNQSKGAAANPTNLLEASHGVGTTSIDEITLREIKVFNDYVAILRVPKQSTIALPDSDQFTPIGIVIGIGDNCVNKFSLGQHVIINPKDPGIVRVVEQGPEYEGHTINLYQERNIFYAAGYNTINLKVVEHCSHD